MLTRFLSRFIAIAAVTVLLTTACGAATPTPTALKIAMVLPGPINDQDWNSVGYNGLQLAGKNLGVEVAYTENVADADAERVIRDYASRGYGLIFAHSFSFGDAALAVAKDFPKTIFMAGTAQKLADNLGTYDNPDYQGAYLVGMLAAGISKKGTIGWVSGLPVPNLLANLHGFTAGAMEVNTNVKVLHSFIGSFYDPPKAKEAALAQVEQGADVLSAQGVGVIDAAVDKSVWVLGAMTDQNHLGPAVVLTSVTWDLAPLITAVGKDVVAGKWTSKNWSFGIVEGSISLAPFHDLDKSISPDVIKRVQDKFQAIKSGQFVVPHDTSEVK